MKKAKQQLDTRYSPHKSVKETPAKAKKQLVATRASPRKSVKGSTPKAKKQRVPTRSSPRESVLKETPKPKKQLVATRSSPRKLFCSSASSSKNTDKSTGDNDAHGCAEKQPKSTLPCPRSSCKEMRKELAGLKERYGELEAKYRRLLVNRPQELGKFILVAIKSVFGKNFVSEK